MTDKTTDGALEADLDRAVREGDYRRARRLQRKIDASAARGASTRTGEPATAARRAQGAREEADRRARRLTAIAGASVAVALGATALAGYIAVDSGRALATVNGDLREVVTAASDLEPGAVISEADLRVAGVPSAYVPTDAATDPAEVVGRRTLTAQTAGMPVGMSTVAASPSPASLPAALGEGMLGIMLTLDPAASASPLLAVGDRVDVLASVSDGAVSTTEVVASDVRVIALDARLSGGGGDGYSSVTLELDPETAARVTSAPGVHLAVRPPAVDGEGAGDAE